MPAENSSNNNNNTDTVPFPAPQVFDVLPPLHALLLRLITSQTNPQQPTTTVPDTGAAVPASAPTSNNNLAPPPHQNSTTSVPQPSDSAAPNPPLKADLDTKSLVTEASTVKIRIQKAKAALETLPDIGRTVGEQGTEIEELEAKIERLKGVIGEFGRRSGGGGLESGKKLGGDVDMEMGYS